MAKAVCNASPIIGLITIGKLKLLWELFEEVYIPQAVYGGDYRDSTVSQTAS
jgi:predicted nucleic acid-binding protein